MNRNSNKMQVLSAKQREELLGRLKARFEGNMGRHKGLQWDAVQVRLEGQAGKLWSLYEMERTGGEPDVVSQNLPAIAKEGRVSDFCFYDCSQESPKGRRSLCYDRAALEARKKFAPKNSAIEMAVAMGIELLDEDEYRALQELGSFDTKTSSWIKTPLEIRSLGGAIFADRRYDSVFVYHNGADSYYAARGFRGLLRV